MHRLTYRNPTTVGAMSSSRIAYQLHWRTVCTCILKQIFAHRKFSSDDHHRNQIGTIERSHFTFLPFICPIQWLKFIRWNYIAWVVWSPYKPLVSANSKQEKDANQSKHKIRSTASISLWVVYFS